MSAGRAFLSPVGLLAALAISSCGGGERPAAGGQERQGAGHAHGAGMRSVTLWSERTELFAEFPALAVGEEAPFAIHLTRLADFRPVESGRVAVVLSGGSGDAERFEAGRPAAPGIFRPVVRPRQGGKRRVVVTVEAGDGGGAGESSNLVERHDLGEVTVHAGAAAARAESPREAAGGEEAISFLKEQQWRLGLETVPVTSRTLRPSLGAYGTLRARDGGECRVTAPVRGRLLAAGAAFPRLGTDVAPGELLAVIVPELRAAHLATLELAVERARLDRDHGRRERERLERLLRSGAVPERRVAAARLAEEEAAAELRAAERRLEHHRRLAGKVGEAAEGGIEVRAPLGGTIVAASVTPGAFLEEGQEMFHLVDLDRLWLEARVAESQIARLGTLAGAWFEADGFERPFALSREALVAAGGLVDPRSRTVPVIFEVANEGRRLPAGLAVRVQILAGDPMTALAVPAAAVVHEQGERVVFVQVGGESFARRPVTLGLRDGPLFEVLAGLRAGERVVTRGAYVVKLAASATAVPAHGHTH